MGFGVRIQPASQQSSTLPMGSGYDFLIMFCLATVYINGEALPWGREDFQRKPGSTLPFAINTGTNLLSVATQRSGNIPISLTSALA
jgi:Na+/H+ antiporter NhaB